MLVLIDTNVFRDTNLSKIIESFNDYLCESQIGQNNSIEQTYSQMKKDLKELQAKLLESNNKIVELTEKNDSLNKAVSELEIENTEYKETEQKILELLKPRM